VRRCAACGGGADERLFQKGVNPTADGALRRNAAPWDRALRVVLGAALVLGAPAVLHGGYLLVAAGVAAGFLFDGALTGHCVFYARLGVSTLEPRPRLR